VEPRKEEEEEEEEEDVDKPIQRKEIPLRRKLTMKTVKYD
jgi:hypothetical protein